jgi:hypothetical protein
MNHAQGASSEIALRCRAHMYASAFLSWWAFGSLLNEMGRYSCIACTRRNHLDLPGMSGSSQSWVGALGQVRRLVRQAQVTTARLPVPR